MSFSRVIVAAARGLAAVCVTVTTTVAMAPFSLDAYGAPTATIPTAPTVTTSAATAPPTSTPSVRSSADRRAQGTLEGALVAAQILAAPTGSFAAATTASLAGADPSTTYLAGDQTSLDDRTASVSVAGSEWAAAAASTSGQCFWIHARGSAVSFGSGTPCTGAAAIAATGTSWAGDSTSSPTVPTTNAPRTTSAAAVSLGGEGITRTADGHWLVPARDFGLGATIEVGAEAAEIDIPIPAGMRAVGVRGRFAARGDLGKAELVMLIGSTTLPVVDLSGAGDAVFDRKLSDQALGDDLVLVVRAVLSQAHPEQCLGRSALLRAEVDDMMVELDGGSTPPTTIAEYFPPVLSRLEIEMAAKPERAVVEAAMNAVARVSTHYPDHRPEIVIVPEGGPVPDAETAPPTDSPFTRRITIVSGGDPAIRLDTSAGHPPELQISGDAGAIVAASRLIDTPGLGAVATAQVRTDDVPKPQAEAKVGTRSSVGELKIRRLKAEGLGRVVLPISVSQTMLGGPVKEAEIRLVGHTTPADGTLKRGTLSIEVNNQILSSTSIGPTGAYDVTVRVGADLIRRNNTVALIADLASSRATCGADIEPVAVEVDPRSTFTVAEGWALPPGFERFPEAYAKGFDVALATGDLDEVWSACILLQLLQYQSSSMLAPKVVGWTDAAGSNRPRLFVGGTASDLASFDPPLAPGLVSSYSAKSVLQAFVVKGHDQLVLSGPGDGASLRQLVTVLAKTAPGWEQLEGDVLLPVGTDAFRTLRLRGREQTAGSLGAKGSSGPGALRLFAVGAAAAAALGGLGWGSLRLFKRD